MQSNLKDVIWTVPVAFFEGPAEVEALCWVTLLSSLSCGAAKFCALVLPRFYKKVCSLCSSDLIVYQSINISQRLIENGSKNTHLMYHCREDGIQTTSCGCCCCCCCWPQHGRPFRCLTPLQLNHLLSCLCYTHCLTNPSAGHPSTRTMSFAYICHNIFNSFYAENSAGAGGRRRHRSTVSTEATPRPLHIFNVVTCNSNCHCSKWGLYRFCQRFSNYLLTVQLNIRVKEVLCRFIEKKMYYI